MMKDIEYYYNDKGEIGILVSYGYGAGWSSWSEYGIKLAVDKRIIEKFNEHIDDDEWRREIDSFHDNDIKTEFQNFLSSIGYDNVYLGGLKDCELVFVPKGSAVRITEYDGNENLEIGYTDYTVLD